MTAAGKTQLAVLVGVGVVASVLLVATVLCVAYVASTDNGRDWFMNAVIRYLRLQEQSLHNAEAVAPTPPVAALARAADAWTPDGALAAVAYVAVLHRATPLHPMWTAAPRDQRARPCACWAVLRPDGADGPPVFVALFRGTVFNNEWSINSRANLVPWARGPGRVHRGFAEIYARCIADVARAHRAAGAPRVCVAGYSMGAALAQLFLVDAAPAAGAAYLFASPRVGDPAFAAAVAAVPVDARFVVNVDDPIHCLLRTRSGFQHAALPVHAFVDRADHDVDSHSLRAYWVTLLRGRLSREPLPVA